MNPRILLEALKDGALLAIRSELVADLGPIETASLVRQAAALASTVGGPYEPPYVIAAELPYSDVDNDQQTLAYTWAVRFGDRAAADAALVACRVELERVGNWWHLADTDPAVPLLLKIPEQRFELAGVEDCATVAAAVASLRASLVVHADRPLRSVATVIEGRYWARSGLTAEQRTWILGAMLTLFDDVDTDDRPAGGALVESLATYVAGGADDDPDAPSLSDGDAIALLRRWVAGEDLTGGAWSG